MKSYVKTTSGLEPQNTTCIKVYSTLEKVNEAIKSGELKENELFATCISSGIHEDIVNDVNFLLSIISPNATPENKLVTLVDIATDYVTKDYVDNFLSNKVDCSDYNTTITSLADDISNRVSQVCFFTELSNIQSDLSDRVTCSDYSSDMSYLSSSISDLTANKVNCSDYNTAIDNKVTCSDFQQWQIDITDSINSDFCCRVQCYDYNQYVSSNNTAISNINTTLSNKVTCSDYNTKITSLENCISSLNTTIQNLTDRISNLESCAGLDCVGTLTCNNFEYDGNGNLNIVL